LVFKLLFADLINKRPKSFKGKLMIEEEELSLNIKLHILFEIIKNYLIELMPFSLKIIKL